MREVCHRGSRLPRTGHSAVAIAAIAATWLFATAAEIRAERYGIVVVEVGDTPVPGSEIRAAAVATAAGLGEVIGAPFAVGRAAIEAGAVPRETIEGFVRAEETMRSGWRAYLAVAAEFAAARLIAARQEAEPLLGYTGGLDLYAEISLRLGAVYLNLGRVSEADEAFRLAAAVAPERPVTENEFSPDIVAAYHKAQAVARPMRSVAIGVRTDAGAPSTLEVDGRPLAPGERSLSLAEGRHVVVARSPGHASVSREFEVGVDEASHRVELVLERDPAWGSLARGEGGFAPGSGEAATSAAAQQLAIFADLDELIFVAAVWRRQAPALIAQRCTARPRLDCRPPAETGFARTADLTTAMREVLARAGEGERGFPVMLPSDIRVARAERSPNERVPTPPFCQACRSPWLWVGVGAVALSAGAIYLSTRDRETVPVVTLNPCAFGQCSTP